MIVLVLILLFCGPIGHLIGGTDRINFNSIFTIGIRRTLEVNGPSLTGGIDDLSERRLFALLGSKTNSCNLSCGSSTGQRVSLTGQFSCCMALRRGNLISSSRSLTRVNTLLGSGGTVQRRAVCSSALNSCKRGCCSLSLFSGRRLVQVRSLSTDLSRDNGLICSLIISMTDSRVAGLRWGPLY